MPIQAIDTVIREFGWTGGLPATDGSRWLFVTRWDDASGTVSVAGDFDDWTPGTHPATAAATGVHWYVLVDDAVIDAGDRYRWHTSEGDAYRDPPESTAYGYDAFGLFGYVSPPSGLAWRERFPDLDTEHLVPPRTLRALLPADFTAGGSYRTLLLHDGQNVMNPDAIWGGWQADVALAAPEFADVVLLAVDNAADRLDAYTHTTDVADFVTYGGQAAGYHGMLTEAVLPFFRDRYGLAAEGDSLMIAGSSLGGLLSLWIGMTDDSLAGCVGAMSPSLFWGASDPSLDGSQALANLWSAHGTTAVYLDSGGDAVTCSDDDGDGIHEDTADFDNYCETAQMRDVLAGLGYAFDVDLWHWHEPGAEHNEAAWAARLPRMLQACSDGGWTAAAAR
ncbi:MAG: hypothetical protein GY898_32930 [Proteobacteria bacterium]|nr:hypothetical protein [Pseudomonadota bacterium]